MITRAAANDKDIASAYNRVAKCLYFVLVLIGGGLDTSALFEYLFNSIVSKFALVGVSKLPCDFSNAPCHWFTAEIDSTDACSVDYCHVSIIQKHRLICVLQKAKHIT